MELPVAIAGFLISLPIVWLLIRLILAIRGTIVWRLSGEAGSLMPTGFQSRGRRFRHTAELRHVVNQVSTAMRLGLPLASALQASALGAPRRMAQILGEMANLLSGGCPVYEAFERAVPRCPAKLVSYLLESECNGQIRNGLEQVEAMLDACLREEAPERNYTLLYVMFLVFALFWMLGSVMIFVMPRFWQIFADFGVSLPPATLRLISISRWLADSGLLLFGIVLMLLVAVFLIALFGSRRGSPLEGLVGSLRWIIPPTRQIDFGLGMASAARLLANNLRAGLPLGRAVDLAPAVNPGNALRPRLEHFRQSVHSGVLPHQAAREAGLGEVMVSVLRIIEHGEQAERPLSHAADYYQSSAFRWWHLLSSLSVPLVTLTGAVLVGLIAYSLFLPLIQLIDAVGDSIV